MISIISVSLWNSHLLGVSNVLITDLFNHKLDTQLLLGPWSLVIIAIILFVIRFVFSMLSYGSSVPGGIFMPILVLGAIEKAPFTAIMLLTEMVGTVQQVLPLIIVTFISYYVLDLLDGKPIYEALRLHMGYK